MFHSAPFVGQVGYLGILGLFGVFLVWWALFVVLCCFISGTGPAGRYPGFHWFSLLGRWSSSSIGAAM